MKSTHCLLLSAAQNNIKSLPSVWYYQRLCEQFLYWNWKNQSRRIGIDFITRNLQQRQSRPIYLNSKRCFHRENSLRFKVLKGCSWWKKRSFTRLKLDQTTELGADEQRDHLSGLSFVNCLGGHYCSAEFREEVLIWKARLTSLGTWLKTPSHCTTLMQENSRTAVCDWDNASVETGNHYKAIPGWRKCTPQQQLNKRCGAAAH